MNYVREIFTKFSLAYNNSFIPLLCVCVCLSFIYYQLTAIKVTNFAFTISNFQRERERE